MLFLRTKKEKNDLQASITHINCLPNCKKQDLPQTINHDDEDLKQFKMYREKYQNLSPFQKELISNMFKNKYHHEYSMEFKQCCYIAYTKSSSCYALLASLIPLPCEKTLTDAFQSDVDVYKEALLNPEKCNYIYNKKESNTESEDIPCVISVDAFAASVFRKKKEINEYRHCFIFNMQPFPFFEKPFIVHLEPSLKGNGSKEIDKLITYFIHLPSKYHVYFISVDGDLHYDSFFSKQFERLLNLYKEGGIENVQAHLIDDGPVWSSDFLHIDKNVRFKLMNNKCIINPFVPQKAINSFIINSLLDVDDALTDRSCIGKMRDIYPLILFTVRNSLILLNSYTRESFFYFIVFALWSESKMNETLAPKTRLFIVNVVLHIMICIYEEYIKPLPSNVSMKNTCGCFQLFLSHEKLKRIIPTLMAESFSLKNYCENLAIDRLSSHPCENRIGVIRYECNGDNSMNNIIRSTARYEFAKDALQRLGINIERRSRLNKGGCRTNMGDIEFNFEMNEIDLANLIMKVGFYKNSSEEETEFLFQKLNRFQFEAPYKIASNFTITANITILNRIISDFKYSFDYSPQYKKAIWSSADQILMDRLLLSGYEDMIPYVITWIIPETLKKKIEERKNVLAYRKFTDSEMELIDQYNHHLIGFDELLEKCQVRTKESLLILLKSFHS